MQVIFSAVSDLGFQAVFNVHVQYQCVWWLTLPSRVCIALCSNVIFYVLHLMSLIYTAQQWETWHITLIMLL